MSNNIKKYRNLCFSLDTIFQYNNSRWSVINYIFSVLCSYNMQGYQPEGKK
jgi:hypothetical protein